MRIKLNPRKEELIEAMLRSGMKVGEIQAIFPNLNSATLHSFGKSLGINTRVSKDKSSIENRDTEAIKRLIKRSIEEGIIEETPKIDTLLNIIDEVAPTTNGKNGKITVALQLKRKEDDERWLQEEQIRRKIINTSLERNASILRDDGDER